MEKRQRNSRGEGVRLRDEAIAAAMRLLDHGPASAISLRTVAREAGVAAPSLYSHFPDAQALFAEVVRCCWDMLGDIMAEAGAHAAEEGAAPIGILSAQMSAYVLHAMERPARYKLLFALPPISFEEPTPLHGLLRPAYRQVLGSLQALEEGGAIMPASSLHDVALLILSLAHGRIALAHIAPDRPGNAPQAVSLFVTTMLQQLFGPRLANPSQ